MKLEQPEKQYTHVDHSVYSCQYHIVFCPKYRRPVLVSGVDTRLKQLFVSMQEDFGYKLIDCEVMPDHVHLLVSIPPTGSQWVTYVSGSWSTMMLPSMTGGGYGYAQTISTSGNYEMWTVFNNTSDTSGDVGNLTKFVVSDGLILASTGDTYLINGISSDTVNSYVITLWNISAYHHG